MTVTDKSGQMYEAEVNATTGKVTATEKTSIAEEASEAAADAKAAPRISTGESRSLFLSVSCLRLSFLLYKYLTPS